jgi:flagellar biosynthetic protein FliR
VLLAGPLLARRRWPWACSSAFFQAATQIQEMTLSFIPKLLALVVALFVAGPWMIQVFVTYSRRLIMDIPGCSADGYGLSPDDIIAMLQTYIWPFLRVSAMMLAAPIFSAASFTCAARVLLAVMIAVLVVPILPAAPAVDPLSRPRAAAGLREVGIGLVMGFVMQLVFGAVVIAGHSVAMSMGLGFAMSVDPQNGIQVPVVSQLNVVLATLLFLAIDGHLMLIAAVVESFSVLPVASAVRADGMSSNVVSLGSQLFASALLLGLPTLTAILMINVAFGVITRAAPQLNIFAVGFPVTIVAGFLFMLLALPAFIAAMQRFLSLGLEQTLLVLG